jgi:PGAP1-like protein
MIRKRRNHHGSESQQQPEDLQNRTVVSNDEETTDISSSRCGLVADEDVFKDKDERTNGVNGDENDETNGNETEKSRLLASSPLQFQERRCKNAPRRSNNAGGVVVVVCRLAALLLHVTACLFYAMGVHQAQTRLHTHEECDMTYSRRQFLQLELNEASCSLPLLTRDGKNLNDGDTEDDGMETTTDYRLYKFFDQRDPRHTNFLNVPEEQALGGNDWCTHVNNSNRTTRTVVVYVPGHAGSFQQSRSLGAHGLGLTSRLHGTHEQRIVHALGSLTGSLTGQDAAPLDDINHFVYDVYALDFREQGSGLHGALLEEQARFLVRCIHHLATRCHMSSSSTSSSIYIVAHSMGGIVARLAMARHGHIMKPSGVHSIITLGTPHAHPVMAWDSSIHSIYQELSTTTTTITTAAGADHDNTKNVLLLISISGGLRDEMIPPTSCIIPSDSNRIKHVDENDDMVLVLTNNTRAAHTDGNSLTLLGPQHMVVGTVEARGLAPSLGMDHRAIVWCHNLLSTVRSILYVLAKKEDQQRQQQPHQQYLKPMERLDRVKAQLGLSDTGNDGDDYRTSVQDMKRTLRVRLDRYC